MDVSGYVWFSLGGRWNFKIYVCFILGYEVIVEELVGGDFGFIYWGSFILVDFNKVFFIW